jgi:hypothetical protein
MPENLAHHDLRSRCARFCHLCGGELERIHFLLGHASVQTTERYIGCQQNLREAVNDRFEISVVKRCGLKSLGLAIMVDRDSVLSLSLFAADGIERLRLCGRGRSRRAMVQTVALGRQAIIDPEARAAKLTVYEVALRAMRECSVRPLESHPKHFTFLLCASCLKIRPLR